MSITADVLIAGGGAMGCAAAYFLKALGPKGLKVVVCEPDPTYKRAATTLSAGGIRQQFSTPENILMSQFGFEFMQEVAEKLAVGDNKPDVDLHRRPYLHLASGGDVAAMKDSHDLQLKLGARPLWLDRGELRAQFPWLSLNDVDAGILGGPHEGLFDPHSLLQALRRKASDLGVIFIADSVETVEFGTGGQVSGATTDKGTSIACGTFVNAAGPKAGRLAEKSGIMLPVIPVRAHTFVFKVEQPPVTNLFPIVVDQIQLLNFRPEGGMFIAGSPREGGLVDAGNDFTIDYDFFDHTLWPLLATRVPAFEAIKMTNAWVGHMEWSVPDANPFIGPHPQHTNYHFIAGFSGHGAQHCPAAGRGLAEWILTGSYQSIDLLAFGFERIEQGRKLIEKY